MRLKFLSMMLASDSTSHIEKKTKKRKRSMREPALQRLYIMHGAPWPPVDYDIRDMLAWT